MEMFNRWPQELEQPPKFPDPEEKAGGGDDDDDDEEQYSPGQAGLESMSHTTPKAGAQGNIC